MRMALSLCTALALSTGCFAQMTPAADSLPDLVNPLMGTDSKFELSNGNTYPAIGLPWGMNMWTPQTGRDGDGWQYTYHADKIRGFKQTHQPSPWMNDYGVFSLMPVTGHAEFREEERASWFSHKAETVKPYYYSVYLADQDVTTEMTTTERAAYFRFTYPKTDSAFLVLDAFQKGSYVKIIPAERKIIGYSSYYARGPLKNFRNYFVLQFDHDFSSAATWNGDRLQPDTIEASGEHMGALLRFAIQDRGEQVQVKVASSFISAAQAEINLRELQGKDFNGVEASAKAAWSKALGKVQVEGGTDSQLRTFYSCLYRMLFFPNKLYERDATGKTVHYSPYDGQVHDGYLYGGTGFWDTFRALYPFLNLVYPSVSKEMQEGLLNDYKEGGWLPEWSSPGYADIMIGNNSASVVSDAFQKGLRGYDIEKLYEALLHGANHEGPISAVGRKGVDDYNRLGYVPVDVKVSQSVARTLEYAYDDFCIYQLAKALKRPKDEIALYAARCQHYRNVFDSSHLLMRGRNADGSWQADFDPTKWGGAFTEGNSWHYSWSVFHDMQGLIGLMGGQKMFVQMLDSVFKIPSSQGVAGSRHVIHEMREMQVMNMGQYAHGNQPIQHMLYLYNYAGAPWKTQYWVREAMNRLYKATPDGYCGDEDNGQTSAWYVFSAMGFYPVCPATTQYVMGAPLFRKVTLELENGKSFVITAPQNSAANRYVAATSLNGQAYTHNWIDHTTILQGGRLELKMSAVPNYNKGTSAKDFPYSFSTTGKE